MPIICEDDTFHVGNLRDAKNRPPATGIAAMLNRGKGRDYYDVMFLLAQTPPNYPFLKARCGIHSLPELKAAVEKSLHSADLTQKQKDFEHLLFHRDNSRRILHFREFIRSL
jgi:hypothetical protein